MRVYTKKVEFAEIVQEGYRAILTRLQQIGQLFLDDVGAEQAAQEGSVVPTPPAMEAPTTPKASHSRKPSFTFGPSPFSINKFTDPPKNRSVSPMRGPETELRLPPMAKESTPSPSHLKRKRSVELRQDDGSSKKTRKKKK